MQHPPDELIDLVITHLSSFHPISDSLRHEFGASLFEIHVNKGDYLLRQGETSEYLYFIVSGIIIGFTTRKGKRLTTYICTDGDSVSSISGMYGESPSEESMYAVEDTHLVGLRICDLMQWLEHSLEMNIIIRKILESFYKSAHERSNLVRMGTAQEKYEHYMASSVQHTDRVPLKYIADFLDIRPQTLSKIIQQRHSEVLSTTHQSELIDSYMVEHQAFKQKGLTLSAMAVALSIPTHQLSHILNEHYKKGFNAFVNGYRIEFIKDKLRNNAGWQHLKIEALGIEGGFSSRSVFFAEFKAHVGMSPAEYAKMQSQTSPIL